MLAIVFAFNFLYMPVETALPLLVRELPGGGAGALGIAWAGFGGGALVGALGTNHLRSLPRRPLLIGVIALWSCVVIVLAMSTSVPAVTATFVCAGLIYAPFVPVAYSEVQSCLTRGEEQPVITVWTTVCALAAPLGLGASGPLVTALGARGGMVASALMCLLLGLVAVRVLRPSTPAVRAASGTGETEL